MHTQDIAFAVRVRLAQARRTLLRHLLHWLVYVDLSLDGVKFI